MSLALHKHKCKTRYLDECRAVENHPQGLHAASMPPCLPTPSLRQKTGLDLWHCPTGELEISALPALNHWVMSAAQPLRGCSKNAGLSHEWRAIRQVREDGCPSSRLSHHGQQPSVLPGRKRST